MAYYYKKPNTDLDNGLTKLEIDKDVLDLLKYVDKYKVMEVFVDHSVSKQPKSVDEGMGIGQTTQPKDQDSLGADDNDVEVDVSDDEWLQNTLKKLPRLSKDAKKDLGQSSRNKSMVVEVVNKGENAKEDGAGQSSRNLSMVVKAVKDVENAKVDGAGQSSMNETIVVEVDKDDEDVNEDGANISDSEQGSNTEKDLDSEEGSDSDDSEFIVDEEHMIDDAEVDMDEFYRNTDGNVEWIGCTDITEKVTVVDDETVDEVDHEAFDSLSESDDEVGVRKKALRMVARKQKDKVASGGPIWKENFYVGQEFANSQLIKQMVSRVAVEQRRQLWLKKNDKKRVRAVCRGQVPNFAKGDMGSVNGPSYSKGPKGGKSTSEENALCPWALQCSKLPNEDTWAVKTFDDTHTCLQSRIIKKCTATFLSRDVEETIKPNPKIPLSALKEQLQKNFDVGVSKQKAFRAKIMANDRVIGDYTKQFAHLRDYCMSLKGMNPNTTIKIEVQRNSEDIGRNERKFKRIYVCLGPLKEGFKAGKRDLLGLDGCFMSGQFPGQILTAVGVDPNSGIYPLAYAIVEAETKDSWKWFLDCLGDDLGLFRNSNFTFISDRQKVCFLLILLLLF